MRVEVIEDLAGAEAVADAWDGLVVDRGFPLCAPGWMLPWWRHLAPQPSELRIVAAWDGDQLVALAPWFSQRGARGRVDLRFLGAEISDRVDVLCSDDQREVAKGLRQAIASMRPRPDLVAFEAVPAGSPWALELSRARRRMSRYRSAMLPAPTVTLAGWERPDAWLGSRSSNFRSQMRRMRRRLTQRGGQVRHITDPAEIPVALDALLRLNAGRWDGRGLSGLQRPGVQQMVHEAASQLGPDRLRLWAVEIGEELVSVQLFLAAGGEIKYWNGGWAEEHGDLKPTMLTILAALEDGIARGERRLDLGAGMHAYKMRFADGDDALTWGGAIVGNRRWPLTGIEMAPNVLRYRAKRLLRSLPRPQRGDSSRSRSEASE